MPPSLPSSSSPPCPSSDDVDTHLKEVITKAWKPKSEAEVLCPGIANPNLRQVMMSATSRDIGYDYDEDGYPDLPAYSIVLFTDDVVSFETATIKMKKQNPINGCLRLYGSIEVLTATMLGDFYLYEKTSDSPDNLFKEDEDDEFIIPISLPCFTTRSFSTVGFEIFLYDADADHDGKLPLLSIESGAVLDGLALNKPLQYQIESDLATLTIRYTRIEMAITAYVSFRVFKFHPPKKEGEEATEEVKKEAKEVGFFLESGCSASGTIRAKQILREGQSRMLTLFESSVPVPFGRSIPLNRPVIEVPVQFPHDIDSGKGGWVELEFDLDMSAEDDSIISQGNAKVVLQQYHAPSASFCPLINMSRKRKSSNSNVFDKDGFKISIMVTPFHQYRDECMNSIMRQRAA